MNDSVAYLQFLRCQQSDYTCYENDGRFVSLSWNQHPLARGIMSELEWFEAFINASCWVTDGWCSLSELQSFVFMFQTSWNGLEKFGFSCGVQFAIREKCNRLGPVSKWPIFWPFSVKLVKIRQKWMEKCGYSWWVQFAIREKCNQLGLVSKRAIFDPLPRHWFAIRLKFA